MKFSSRPQLIFIFVLIAAVASWGASFVGMDDIETAIIEKDYEGAQSLAQEFLAQKPPKAQADQARYYSGLSQLRLNNYTKARGVFERLKASASDAKFIDQARIGIVDSYSMEGEYQQAIHQAENFLKTKPESELMSLIYLKLARAHLKLARWETAKGYLKKIMDQYPQSLEYHPARQLLEEKQYFAVQLGAFLDRGNAESLMEDLKAKGEYAYIVETTNAQGQKFYRVRVGQFSGLKEAEGLMTRLSQEGYPTLIYP